MTTRHHYGSDADLDSLCVPCYRRTRVPLSMEIISSKVNALLSGPPQWTAKDCQRLLTLAVNRIRLQKRKQGTLNDNRKREVAALLDEEKIQQAEVKALAVIHDDYLAQIRNIVEVYLEQLLLRTEVMQAQRSCPFDMVEQVCGICYIAPFLPNSPELLKLRDHYTRKYHDIVAYSVRKRLISPIVIDRLSRSPSSKVMVDYYLGTVAMQFDIDWTPPQLNFDTPEPDDVDETPLRSENSSLLARTSPDVELLEASPSSSHIVSGLYRVDTRGHAWVVDSQPIPIFIAKPPSELEFVQGQRVWVKLDARNDGKRSGVLTSPPSTPKPNPKDGTTATASPSIIEHTGFVVEAIVNVDRSQHVWVSLSPHSLSLSSMMAESVRVVIVRASTMSAVSVDWLGVRIRLDARRDGKLSGVIEEVLSSPQPRPSSPPSMDYQKPKEGLVGTLKKDVQQHMWFLIDPSFHPSLDNTPYYVAPTDLTERVRPPSSATCLAQDGDRVVLIPHSRSDGLHSGYVHHRLRPGDLAPLPPVPTLSSPSPVSTLDEKDQQQEGEVLRDVNGHHWLLVKGASSPFASEPGENIFIPAQELHGATSGDWVLVRRVNSSGSTVIVRVVKVLRKSRARVIQLIGTFTQAAEDMSEGQKAGGGFVVSVENDLSVYVPAADCRGAEDGDVVLVEARTLPSNHEMADRASLIGSIARVVEKGKLAFEGELHLTSTPGMTDIPMGWLTHPIHSPQRLNGAVEGSRVKVLCRSVQGKLLGQVIQVLSSPSAHSQHDELDAFSAVWDSLDSLAPHPPSSDAGKVIGEDSKAPSSSSLSPPTSSSIASSSEASGPYVPITTEEAAVRMKSLLAPIVITCGSDSIRCGLVSLEGDLAALRHSVEDRLVVGTPIFSKSSLPPMIELRTHYFGQDCDKKRGILRLSRPIDGELVVNWTDFEEVLRHHFITTLQVDASRHPICLSLGNRLPDDDRNTLLSLLYHAFRVPLVCVVPEYMGAVAAAGLGEESGLVVALGEVSTWMTPFAHGSNLVYATHRSPVAGAAVSERLEQLLRTSGQGAFESLSEKAIVRRIKEEHGRVSMHSDSTSHDELKVSAQLPDGTQISLNQTVLEAAGEVLFDPSPMGYAAEDGVGVQLVRALRDLDVVLREEVIQNIILTGGTANLHHLQDRLLSILSSAFPSLSPRIVSPSSTRSVSPQHIPWIGLAMAIRTGSVQLVWHEPKSTKVDRDV